MSIILVTPPDDDLRDALRICLIGLDKEQTAVVSSALIDLETENDIIVYMWSFGELDWLFDKKHKSSMLFFNAEQENQELVGYLAAQPNSYYFGTMRSLGIINRRAVHDKQQFLNLIREKITDDE